MLGLLMPQTLPPPARTTSGFSSDSAIGYAKAHRHPERRDVTIWEAFEAERPSLVAYAGRLDGFHALPAAVSKTCLVRFDNNKYSVAASAIGRPVEIRAYADRVELCQDGRIVGEHARSYGRDQTTFDPWHYVPVLTRKPGALQSGGNIVHRLISKDACSISCRRITLNPDEPEPPFLRNENCLKLSDDGHAARSLSERYTKVSCVEVLRRMRETNEHHA